MKRKTSSSGFAPILAVLLIIVILGAVIWATIKYQGGTLFANRNSSMASVAESIGQLQLGTAGYYTERGKPTCKLKGETVNNFKSTLATTTAKLAVLKASLTAENKVLSKMQADYKIVKPIADAAGKIDTSVNAKLYTTLLNTQATLNTAQYQLEIAASSIAAKRSVAQKAVTVAQTAVTKAETAWNSAQKKWDDLSDYQKGLVTSIPVQIGKVAQINANIKDVNLNIKALSATIIGFASLKECAATETLCSDSIDNNRNGRTDCGDSACPCYQGTLTAQYDSYTSPKDTTISAPSSNTSGSNTSSGSSGVNAKYKKWLGCYASANYPIMFDTLCNPVAVTQDTSAGVLVWITIAGIPSVIVPVNGIYTVNGLQFNSDGKPLDAQPELGNSGGTPANENASDELVKCCVCFMDSGPECNNSATFDDIGVVRQKECSTFFASQKDCTISKTIIRSEKHDNVRTVEDATQICGAESDTQGKKMDVSFFYAGHSCPVDGINECVTPAYAILNAYSNKVSKITTHHDGCRTFPVGERARAEAEFNKLSAYMKAGGYSAEVTFEGNQITAKTDPETGRQFCESQISYKVCDTGATIDYQDCPAKNSDCSTVGATIDCNNPSTGKLIHPVCTALPNGVTLNDAPGYWTY